MTVNASLRVADEVLASTNGGKLDIRGTYINDIYIPDGNGTFVGQIVFVFFHEGTQADLPQKFRFEVHLPGEDQPRTMEIPVPAGWVIPGGREKWFGTTMFPIGPVMLKTGNIKAAIVLDDRRFELAAPLIVSSASALQSSS